MKLTNTCSASLLPDGLRLVTRGRLGLSNIIYGTLANLINTYNIKTHIVPMAGRPAVSQS